MGYFVRVLSTADKIASKQELETCLQASRTPAILDGDTNADGSWTDLVLQHADGTAISLICCDFVSEGSNAAAELAEFREEIIECEPATASQWLLTWFNKVKCIYSFQILNGTYENDGWDILGQVKDYIYSLAPSITQADAEGFSNEEGFHILWQFNSDVSGPWWMAVLENGQWSTFEMDLGNVQQVAAFRKGLVPADAKRGKPAS